MGVYHRDHFHRLMVLLNCKNFSVSMFPGSQIINIYIGPNLEC